MRPTVPIATAALLALAFAPSWADEKAEETLEEVPEEFFNITPEANDVGNFGSEGFPERTELPERGQVHVGPEVISGMEMAHWDHWSAPAEIPRPGNYTIRIAYHLRRAGMGFQLRIGGQSFKALMSGSPKDEDGHIDVGPFYAEKEGEYPITLLTPTPEFDGQFSPSSFTFIPAPESERPTITEDGSLTLLARHATVWSELMRYEPQENKDCLGFWREQEDFADWDLAGTPKGTYHATISVGCGGGNHGSEVALTLGEQELTFTVPDTGGFQKWQDVELGELEIDGAQGPRFLRAQPRVRAPDSKAFLDIQKVVLRRVDAE